MPKVNQEVLIEYKPMYTKGSHIRYVIVMGGRGGGRSTNASQYALSKLLSPRYFRAAIMRYIFGDIRNSIYREITDRIDEQGIAAQIKTLDNKMVFQYGKNSINAVGFKKSSGDQKSKLKSLAGFTDIIIEEADEIAEEDFMQLDDSLRTIKAPITITLVLNPPSAEHWIIKRFFDLVPIDGIDGYYQVELKPEYKEIALYINTNYTHNIKNMSPQTIDNYERYKETKLHYYYNTIKGYVAQVVFGKIYQGWRIIDEIPHEARLIRRGLDFGFTVDPTVIVDIYEYNGGYILDEIFYRKGASNKVLADFLLQQESPETLVIADSAEPKSIEEIKDHGVNIIGATKVAGSVNQGISFVQSLRISLTRRSYKTKKAYDNYVWLNSRNGELLNVPDDSNHEWSNSMDAIRYGFNGKIFAESRIKMEEVEDDSPSVL